MYNWMKSRFCHFLSVAKSSIYGCYRECSFFILCIRTKTNQPFHLMRFSINQNVFFFATKWNHPKWAKDRSQSNDVPKKIQFADMFSLWIACTTECCVCVFKSHHFYIGNRMDWKWPANTRELPSDRTIVYFTTKSHWYGNKNKFDSLQLAFCAKTVPAAVFACQHWVMFIGLGFVVISHCK